MNNILILGGYGATGRPLTKHLLAQTDHKIVIAGRHLNKAQTFVDSLHNPRVTAAKVEATSQLSGRQAHTCPGGRCQGVEASIEHEDGYELTAIAVAALLMQYDKVRRPGLHMMGHLAEPNCLFRDLERMGVQVRTSIRETE